MSVPHHDALLAGFGHATAEGFAQIERQQVRKCASA